MKQIKNFSDSSEFDTTAVFSLDKNSSLGFCLSLSGLAQRALREYSGPALEGKQACAALQNWSLAACKAHLQTVSPHTDQSGDVEALAVSMLEGHAQGAKPKTQETDHAVLAQSVSDELNTLKGVLNGLTSPERAPAALRAAAELVEYAGYAIAQNDDTTKVIPTFLLAQTLMDRANQA